ncbi:hypothetical protein A5695_24250 [Mycobacterium sp. E1747]|nr:hypothetical protein A5695_24250 [Mycobacterium sp. E1747]
MTEAADTRIDVIRHRLLGCAATLPGRPRGDLDRATGSARHCADRVGRAFDNGADAVTMHGATPEELEHPVAAYRAG